MTSVFRALIGVLVLALAGCGAGVDMRPDASPEVISSASYRHPGPPALTLYTMINGSQRVIFDPAGTVRLSAVPERDDVLYGITPGVADFYARAHARETYHVVIQTVEVPPEVAERALRLAVANGPVASAQCAASTAAILRQLPGFERVGSTWFPKRLMNDFGALPGVQTSRIFENDDDDKAVAIAQFEEAVVGQ